MYSITKRKLYCFAALRARSTHEQSNSQRSNYGGHIKVVRLRIGAERDLIVSRTWLCVMWRGVLVGVCVSVFMCECFLYQTLFFAVADENTSNACTLANRKYQYRLIARPRTPIVVARHVLFGFVRVRLCLTGQHANIAHRTVSLWRDTRIPRDTCLGHEKKQQLCK